MIATDSNSIEVVDYDDFTAGFPVPYAGSYDGYSYGPYSSPAAVSSPSDAELDLYDAGTLSGVYGYNAVSYAADIPTCYVNALRFDVVMDGVSSVLLFPPSCIDSLFIDENGRLWNMSTSNVQGRVVGESFDPYVTEGDLVYLTPCLGNNFNSIYRYGSPNYIRRYRRSGSSLDYDDIYTEIVVQDFHYPFFVSDSWNYITAFLLMGGVLLLWLRSFSHY